MVVPARTHQHSPHWAGLLDVGDGQRIHWEQSGTPTGKPALCVHGGPGAGGSRGSRRVFDPEVFRIIVFDQRGCGQSLPNAADPAVDMTANTTWRLVDDMERLRAHLGIERWLLHGGSWGSTLILAYAQRYPERVSEIVLVGVTMSTPAEINWLYHGAGEQHPDAWEQFRAGAPSADLLSGYHALVSSPDRTVREEAAQRWCAWEDALIAHETLGRPGAYSARVGEDRIAFVRICSHYFAHYAWLDDAQLLRDVDRIAHIPAVLIHGRHDIGCPLTTAQALAAAWPAAELQIIDDSGHTGSPAMGAAVRAAIARFASVR